MEIPLQNRLKKRAHVQIALLQDELVDMLYQAAPKAVLHGGTCIWRCYGGSRFSEDLDLYLPAASLEQEGLKTAILQRGLLIDKWKATKNLLFSKVSSPEAQVRLEISFFAKKSSVVRPYEKADGSRIDVLSLSSEELLSEKLSAYLERRLVRDIYDLHFLAGMAKPDAKTVAALQNFLKKPFPPLDEKNLRALVYAGAVPTYSQMLEGLRGRFL